MGTEDRESVGASAETDDFYVAGVTWDAAYEAEVSTWMRVRTSSGWTDWQEVHSDGHAPDPRPDGSSDHRAGTEPFVSEAADAVEVRVVSEEGQKLPEDLTLDVIDPGPAPVDAQAVDLEPVPDSAIEPFMVAGQGAGSLPYLVPTPTTKAADPEEPLMAIPPRPTIRSRAAWGADETLRRNYGEPTEYGTVLGAFVHHTAGTNSYSSSDVPRLIRGIYRFHVESRNFYDIGYNFLVDRFGRIWEGAYGGVDQAVIGAHTQYYNSQSFSMSVMGDYRYKAPEAAVLTAYKRLFAWKLVLHGVTDPFGTAPYSNEHASPQSVIAGHRDTKATACPGWRMYQKLGDIRRGTAALIAAVPAELTLTGPSSVLFGQLTELTIEWRAGDLPVSGKVNLQRRTGSSWEHVRHLAVVDGHATTVITPGSSNTYRLRTSSTSSPVNIDGRDPAGTSNHYSVNVTPAGASLLTLEGPPIVDWGERTDLVIHWTSPRGPVTGMVNLQRLSNGRWTHIRHFPVSSGMAITTITPGASNSYRLRASVVFTPSGVATSHPAGTSNVYSVKVR